MHWNYYNANEINKKFLNFHLFVILVFPKPVSRWRHLSLCMVWNCSAVGRIVIMQLWEYLLQTLWTFIDGRKGWTCRTAPRRSRTIIVVSTDNFHHSFNLLRLRMNRLSVWCNSVMNWRSLSWLAPLELHFSCVSKACAHNCVSGALPASS